MLSVFLDGVIALLSCIGLAALGFLLAMPRRCDDVFTAGLVVGNDPARVAARARAMRRLGGQVLVVGRLDARALELSCCRATVLTPEQAAEYLAHLAQNTGETAGFCYGQRADSTGGDGGSRHFPQ